MAVKLDLVVGEDNIVNLLLEFEVFKFIPDCISEMSCRKKTTVRFPLGMDSHAIEQRLDRSKCRGKELDRVLRA